MPINSVLRRLWLVCCLCVVCVQAQAQAWQSGNIIAIVYDGNYLTATSRTTVGKTTTPTEASLWVVTVETR
ncbi:MAG: hypothetical protein PUD89_07795, partial [Bacteroidales bacterium]|nr:hypothetical protein [Bacteroidales bacterium]